MNVPLPCKSKGHSPQKRKILPPFKPFCNDYKQLLPPSFFYLIYWLNAHITKQTSNNLYDHSLKCILEKKNKNITCILRNPHLQELFPKLTEISYQ